MRAPALLRRDALCLSTNDPCSFSNLPRPPDKPSAGSTGPNGQAAGAHPGCLRRPRRTGGESEQYIRRRLSELDATATTVERVREVLLEVLPGNATTIEKTSVRLGMSKRTLQRHLEGQGESFRALSNATRENPADRYLTKTNLSGGEIVSLLGFDDPDAFYRAFQDWTGQTPDSARPAMRLN